MLGKVWLKAWIESISSWRPGAPISLLTHVRFLSGLSLLLSWRSCYLCLLKRCRIQPLLPPHHFFFGPSHHHLSWGQSQESPYFAFIPAFHSIHSPHRSHVFLLHQTLSLICSKFFNSSILLRTKASDLQGLARSVSRPPLQLISHECPHCSFPSILTFPKTTKCMPPL